jgi:predicted metal-dependent phosphoesterase TrpH
MRADLHVHTTASDGRWTPERLIAEVTGRSIGLFAVTDHETIANVGRTETLAREAGLAFLRGAEVSARLDDRLFHVLAYDFCPDSPALAALLKENRAQLDRSNDVVIRRLMDDGCPIDLDEYAAYTYDRTRGGWKALNYLIDHGLCTGVPDYFARVDTDPIIPPFSHPAEVIDVIQEAGGVPILAHPASPRVSPATGQETLQCFLDFGIAGVECYHPYHDEATTRFCLDWCDRHDLLVTGGSDCHGGIAGRELGVPAVDTADLRLGRLEERILLGEALQ